MCQGLVLFIFNKIHSVYYVPFTINSFNAHNNPVWHIYYYPDFTEEKAHKEINLPSFTQKVVELGLNLESLAAELVTLIIKLCLLD